MVNSIIGLALSPTRNSYRDLQEIQQAQQAEHRKNNTKTALGVGLAVGLPAAAGYAVYKNPDKAEAGATLYKGTKITGTCTKGTVFPYSGIKKAKAGDMYLNTDTMNYYRCTSGGSAAGIEKFTAHAFRATFTSRCVADGVPVKELMEIFNIFFQKGMKKLTLMIIDKKNNYKGDILLCLKTRNF